jgi:beta-lactamase regulating signal transducer with metallopeptidase domain/uncharacterized protein YjbI with pentapeptide repeats
MEKIYSLAPRELIEALGWTLFHSLWQGMLIAIIFGILLLALMKFSAHSRYIVTMSALLIMIASTSFTFIKEYRNASERALIRQSIVSNPALVVQHFKEQMKTLKPSNDKTTKTQFHLKWILFKAKFQKYFPWMVFIWLLGMSLLTIRFLGGMIVVQRLKYRQTLPPDDILSQRVNVFIEQLGIKQKIKVLQSYLVQVPITLGYFKPVILLPVGLLTGLSAAQVESIIAHELAHIARRDYLFNLLQSLTEIIFFYHPAIWWISSIARTERENCCDDIAIELTGDKLNYAKALANIRVETPETSYAMAFSNNKHKLLKRVKRLLNPHTMKTNFKEGFIASCILFGAILILTIGTSASVKEFNFVKTTAKDTAKASKEVQKDSSISKNKTENISKNNEKIQKENKEIFSEINGLDNISEELGKELEVAFGDLDHLTTNEVLKGIKGAMKEMDLNLIVGEALKGAKAALNNMDVNAIVNESIHKDGKSNQNEAIIAQEAIKGAQAALQEMDLNLIVNEALKGAEGALKEMDIQKIVEESLEKEVNKEIREDLETERPVRNEDNKYLPILKKGTSSWNSYRNENKQVLPDLSRTDISELNLEDVNMVGISFGGASIRKASLNNANMSSINGNKLEIKDTQLNNTNFSNANLNGARFKSNVLQGTIFKNANLKAAAFIDCNLVKCDFRKANLRGTIFSEVNINDCTFRGAVANKDTHFPAGFNPKKKGIVME